MADRSLPKIPVWKQPQLCTWILKSVEGSTGILEIHESSIPNAGSGLFTTKEFKAGDDVFWSDPPLLVPDVGNDAICDYCYADAKSQVHRNGRFIDKEADKTSTKPCSGCRVVSYCSKKCQSKAWKRYHKHECSVFKELKPQLDQGVKLMVPLLCRLTTMLENGALDKTIVAAMGKLSTHKIELNDDFYRDNSNDGNVSPVFHIATSIRELTKPKDMSKINPNNYMCIRQMVDLYCTIASNAVNMHYASDTETVHGVAIDLVTALMNHACDPNVHIYFDQGRKLRCRALKDIPANKELTIHYYPKPVLDVLLRRQVLQGSMYFECNCHKCELDMVKHKQAPKVYGPNYIEDCRVGQEKLLHLTLDAEGLFASQRLVKTCLNFQNRLADIACTGYGNDQRWPSTLAPLPLAYRTLGAMYRDLHYAVGLELVIRGTLYEEPRERNPDWPSQLYSLVRYMYYVASADDEIKWTGISDGVLAKGLIPARRDLRDLGRGYHMVLCRTAKFIFGLDNVFVRALYKWLFNFMGAKDQLGEPETNHHDFAQRYNKTQKSVLEWAQTEEKRRIKLLSREEICELKADYEVICETDKNLTEPDRVFLRKTGERVVDAEHADKFQALGGAVRETDKGCVVDVYEVVPESDEDSDEVDGETLCEADDEIIEQGSNAMGDVIEDILAPVALFLDQDKLMSNVA